MPSCQELTRLIASDELAGAERPVRLKAWLHLLMCRHCRRYAEQTRAIAAAARRSWRPDTDESTGLARLEAEILERCFDERSRVSPRVHSQTSRIRTRLPTHEPPRS